MNKLLAFIVHIVFENMNSYTLFDNLCDIPFNPFELQ